MSKRAPEARLRAFLALCGSKRVCEHTGGPQPAYRVDGMRIMAEFPKPKDDDGMDSFADVERKQEVRPPASGGCSAASTTAILHYLVVSVGPCPELGKGRCAALCGPLSGNSILVRWACSSWVPYPLVLK